MPAKLSRTIADRDTAVGQQRNKPAGSGKAQPDAAAVVGVYLDRVITPTLRELIRAWNTGTVSIRYEDTLIGTRRYLNLHAGDGIVLTIADDSVNEEVDITITANASDIVYGSDTNVRVGLGAGGAFTTAVTNVAVGVAALSSVTSSFNNVAIGAYALQLCDARSNVAVGPIALQLSTSGFYNIAIGENTLANLTNAAQSVAIGVRSQQFGNAGGNVSLGYEALRGSYAGSVLSSGTYNTAVGDSALSVVSTAEGNTALGRNTGAAVSSGSFNTFVGHQACPITTTGTYNVVIGAYVSGTATAATLPSAGLGGHVVIAAHTTGEATGDQIVVVTPGSVFIGADRPGNWLTSTAVECVAIGASAMNSLTSGGQNTVIGAFCGTSLTTGAANILIGNTTHVADTPAVGTNDYLSIGGLLLGDMSLGKAWITTGHNNASPPTGTTAQPLSSSGTYTPTLTNATNVSASTAYQCQWTRTGNCVSVTGKVAVDPTTTLLQTQLGISLPIASNLGAAEDCAGAACCPTISSQSAAILGDAANDRATMEWICIDVTNQPMYFSFMYEVL